jgi:hypothetical protein
VSIRLVDDVTVHPVTMVGHFRWPSSRLFAGGKEATKRQALHVRGNGCVCVVKPCRCKVDITDEVVADASWFNFGRVSYHQGHLETFLILQIVRLGLRIYEWLG